MRFVVDGTLDRTDDFWRRLPLVKQHWLLAVVQGVIWSLSEEQVGLWVIEPNERLGESPGGGRLAACPRACDQHRRNVIEQHLKPWLDESLKVGHERQATAVPALTRLLFPF